MNRAALAVAVAVLIGALWAAVWLALAHFERSVRDEAAATRRNVARGLSEHESSSVRAIDIVLTSLRSAWSRDRAAFEAAVELHEPLLRQEMAVQVAVVDRDGWVRYSRLPQSETVNFADRDYFIELRDGGVDRLSISTPVLGRITRRWAIQFARPLQDKDGRFDGLVVVAVPPPALERLYHDIDLGRGGIVTLARRDGRILARSTDFDKSAGVTLPLEVSRESGDAVAGEFLGRGAVDGVARFVTYRDVPGYPLRIYVGQEVDTVLAPFRNLRAYLVSLAAAATLLVLGIAYVLAMRARERARFAEERERMMLELHDGCIQSIYAIGLNLQDCRSVVGRSAVAADQAIARAQADLNLVIHDLRAFIGGEPRAVLGADELVEEVRRSAAAQRAPALALDLDREAAGALDPEQATHMLRIVREAVSNIVRHSDAGACRITLARTGAKRVRLDIVDDGCGMPSASAPPGSLGLAHIRARARRMGGTATIAPNPDGGTRVSVEFPVDS